MATLDQIGAALKKADAAGNVEDARRLAKAYRAMQGQAAPEPGTVSGPAPELDAFSQSMSGRLDKAFPNAPPSSGASPSESVLATMAGIGEAIPFIPEIGDAIAGGTGVLLGRDYGETVRGRQQTRQHVAQEAPIAHVAGEVGGTLAMLGAGGATKAGAEALGLSGGLGKQVVNSSLSTAGLSGLQSLASGNQGGEVLADMAIDGALGAGAPLVGKVASKVGEGVADALTNSAQRKITSAAIGGSADSAAELAERGTKLFRAVDDAGVRIDTPKFSGLVQRLASDAKKARINPTLDPKSHAAYQELIGTLGDVQKSGASLTVSDLHNLRQIAQKAALSSEGRDAMFAKRIIAGLDDFVTKPGNVALPANRLGDGAQAGGKELMDAIDFWRTSQKVGTIEEAIYRAGNAASGLENGLRVEFRKLLQNRELRRQFTGPELREISAVANGTATSNVLRLMGKFGFGGGSASNMLGGSVGVGAGSLVGGPLAAVAAAVIGAGSRKLSETATKSAAQRAAQAVATPRIPVATPRRNMLEGASSPIELLIRGGALSGTN